MRWLSMFAIALALVPSTTSVSDQRQQPPDKNKPPSSWKDSLKSNLREFLGSPKRGSANSALSRPSLSSNPLSSLGSLLNRRLRDGNSRRPPTYNEQNDSSHKSRSWGPERSSMSIRDASMHKSESEPGADTGSPRQPRKSFRISQLKLREVRARRTKHNSSMYAQQGSPRGVSKVRSLSKGRGSFRGSFRGSARAGSHSSTEAHKEHPASPQSHSSHDPFKDSDDERSRKPWPLFDELRRKKRRDKMLNHVANEHPWDSRQRRQSAKTVPLTTSSLGRVERDFTEQHTLHPDTASYSRQPSYTSMLGTVKPGSLKMHSMPDTAAHGYWDQRGLAVPSSFSRLHDPEHHSLPLTSPDVRSRWQHQSLSRTSGTVVPPFPHVPLGPMAIPYQRHPRSDYVSPSTDSDRWSPEPPPPPRWPPPFSPPTRPGDTSKGTPPGWGIAQNLVRQPSAAHSTD